VQKQCSGNDGVPRHQQINACTRLIESSTLAPEHLANAFYNRGTGYKRIGDFDRAIADFHQAIRLNPTDAEAFCNRGLSYFGKRGLARTFLYSGARALRVSHWAVG